MSEAKEYLKRVGLIQTPYLSQERVIRHLERFAKEQIEAITVTRCSEPLKRLEAISFEEWKDKFVVEIMDDLFELRGDTLYGSDLMFAYNKDVEIFNSLIV